MRLFLLELRLLTRERAALVLTGLFAATLVWGLWNGARLESRHREAARELAAGSEQFLGQVRQALAQPAATTHMRCHSAQSTVKKKAPQAKPSGTKATFSGLPSGGSRTA